MSSLAFDPRTPLTSLGGPGGGAGGTPVAQVTGQGGVQSSVVDNPGTDPIYTPPPSALQGNPNLQLQRNPQLPQHPLGAYTDAQYEAQYAALRSNIAKQYADVLQQLGYVDPQTGQLIQGSVESEANRQRSLLNRQMGLAREDVTHQHQQLGTLFSGLRGTDQARAEFPSVDALGQIDVQTPLSLAQLYEKGSGLMDNFTVQNNQLLADAASRQAANLAANPPDPAGGGLDGGAGAPSGSPKIDPNTLWTDTAGAAPAPTTPGINMGAPDTSPVAPGPNQLALPAVAPPPSLAPQLNPNLIAGIGSTSQKKLQPQVGF